MTQIKISIAFILAAAAIAPIVAQPTSEGNELASNIANHPHHHHHHHHPHHRRHHHKHVEQPPLQQTSDATPSPREFVDELEARGTGEGSVENNVKALEREDSQLEHKHTTLKAQDNSLESTDKHLENKEGHLKHKVHRLQREGGKLKHINHSRKRQGKFLSAKKHHQSKEDNKLGRKHRSILHKNKALGKEEISAREYGESDEMFERDDIAFNAPMTFNGPSGRLRLGQKLPRYRTRRGPVIRRGITAREYGESDEMFERDDIAFNAPMTFNGPGGRLRLGQKLPRYRTRRGPVIRRRIAAREYGESDEMFERAESDDIASNGPVIHRTFNGPGGRVRFGQGRRPLNKYIPKLPRSGIRRGPIIKRGIDPREYVESDDMFERDLEDLEFDAREFDESEDMFERDLEDLELDAREFDDELYLD